MNAAATHHPVGALTWQLWYRYRWALFWLLAYGGLLSYLAHLPRASEWRASLLMAALPLAFGWVFLLAVCTYPDGDVLSRRSGFPGWMLTLPLRTWELALCPVSQGALVGVSAWSLTAAFILRPLGIPAPLWWPSALAATLVAALQALLWSPMPASYLRVVAALVLGPLLVWGGITAAASGLAELPLTLAFGLLALLAASAGVAGLQRVRCGDGEPWQSAPRAQRPGWGSRPRRTSRASEFRESGMSSAALAQLWLEWHTSGKTFPLVTAALSTILTVPLFWVRDLVPIEPNPPRSDWGSIEVNLWLSLQQGILFAPPLLAAILGGGRRTHQSPRGGLTLHPFLATRPLTNQQYVAIRFLAALLSTLAAWTILLFFVTAWLMLPARDGGRVAPLLLLLPRHISPETVLTGALLLLFLVYWTWKNQVQGLFADLSGRPAVVLGAPLLLHGLVLAGSLAFIHWGVQPGEMDPRHRELSPVLPWLLGAGVAAKGCVGLGFASWALRARLLSPRGLALQLVGWTCTVAAVFSLLQWVAAVEPALGPAGRFLAERYLPICSGAVPQALHASGYLLAIAVLFVPFSRLVSAPISLGWNRHR